MTRIDFQSATNFNWLNARLLDRRRFAHHFFGAGVEPVISALSAYQNGDGGFGSGLEPDIRAPISQPQPVEVGLRLLDEVDAFGIPMVASACDYLLSITTPEGGVPFVLPSVRDFPRAPWWESTDDPPASVNPTAALAGLLHRHQVDHPWLGPATDFCWREIEARDDFEQYDMVAVLTFLEFVPDRGRAEAAFERLGKAIIDRGLVELDPAQPGEFSPLTYARRPGSLARRLFADSVVEAHLDGLAGRQQPDGGWPISWPAPSPLAELEWRGSVTVTALLTLRAYGRLA